MGFRPLTLNTPPEEEAHILAEDDAAIFQSIFGKDGVFETGDRMKATVINNNQVRVSNGVICVGGHIGRTEYGDYSDMIIENGEISKNRNDIIMAVFSTTGKTGIDEFKIEVKKGTPGIAAEDPEIVKGDLYEGSKIREFPLWRVKLEGINIVGVEQMFNVIPTIPELEEKIELLNGNSYELHSDGYTHYKKYNNGMLEVWGLVSVSYTNGLGTIVFPDDYCFVDYSSYTLFVSPAYVDSDNAFEIMSTQKMSGKLANVYSRKYPGLSDKLPTHDCDFYAIGRWK